jgi:hypothetical protein
MGVIASILGHDLLAYGPAQPRSSALSASIDLPAKQLAKEITVSEKCKAMEANYLYSNVLPGHELSQSPRSAGEHGVLTMGHPATMICKAALAYFRALALDVSTASHRLTLLCTPSRA